MKPDKKSTQVDIESAKLSVRPAAERDAERMGEIHVRAWQVGYQGILPDAMLSELDPANLADYWHTTLAAAPESDRQNLVGLVDGTVMAIATVGPFRHRKNDDPTGELWMLNADPEAWGSGIARLLHREALGYLVAAGHLSAALWVLNGNARGRRFYEREGWAFHGVTKTEDVGGADAVEYRYEIRLDAPRAAAS